jgi:2,5-diketo-D-gluconate reductase B
MKTTIAAKEARIPALGMGTWQLQGRACAQRVADALAIGYRHLDTAQMYENHESVGEGLRCADVDREDVFLATKLWFENLRRDEVHAATEQSLRELGTDYVDLLLVHWPNEDVPLAETLEAMLEERERGRVAHVGVSNFPPSWVENAEEVAPVVCDQVEYHPLLSQDHLLAPLRARDMALVAYSPLAHGKVLESPTLREIGDSLGRSPAQVALRWLLDQEQVAAIPKAGRREHLEENFAVFDFTLDDEQTRRIDALAERAGERTVDPEFAPSWER